MCKYLKMIERIVDMLVSQNFSEILNKKINKLQVRLFNLIFESKIPKNLPPPQKNSKFKIKICNEFQVILK